MTHEMGAGGGFGRSRFGTNCQKIRAKPPINTSQSHAGVGCAWGALRPTLFLSEDNRRSLILAHGWLPRSRKATDPQAKTPRLRSSSLAC